MLFPYFGGKAKVAPIVWDHLGDPECYIEPFAGIVGRAPGTANACGTEIVVDLDGLLVNFWRSIQHWPEVLPHMTGTVSETDIAAKHAVLLGSRVSLTERLREDPGFYDPVLAAWWWEGISSWLGSGFGHRNAKQRPHIDRSLKGAWANGMTDEKVAGVAKRLGNTVILAGDWKDAWKRSVSPAIIKRFDRSVGVFLDPPYVDTARQKGLYAEDAPLQKQIVEWCLEQPRHVKTVVAGYDDEYPELIAAGWQVVTWKTPNGYAGKGNQRRHNDVLYLSVPKKRIVQRQ